MSTHNRLSESFSLWENVSDCDVVSAHRREELFPDASSFKPERFLHLDSANADFMASNFIPFIYGQRMCLGHRFANVEIRVMLSLLLRTFHFDLDPAGPAVFKRALRITMRPDPPLQLRVSLVNSKWQWCTRSSCSFCMLQFRTSDILFITVAFPFHYAWAGSEKLGVGGGSWIMIRLK